MGKPQAALRSLRPHQWLKNILIFIPTLAAHQFQNFHVMSQSVIAFFAFSFGASIVYVVNDLVDLENDRAHATKCRRPFASGDLPMSWAPAILMTLGVALFVTLSRLAVGFAMVMVSYLLLTTLYSLRLKKVLIVDVVCLSVLYSIRIFAGSAATGIVLSRWLLLFSLFTFLSLALVKRYSELHALNGRGAKKANGRAYQVDDLPTLASLGTSSGFLAVLVFCLYTASPAITALYRRPEFLWCGAVLLVYWFSRLWILAARGEVHEDPVLFALKDRASLVTGLVMAGCVYGSI